AVARSTRAVSYQIGSVCSSLRNTYPPTANPPADSVTSRPALRAQPPILGALATPFAVGTSETAVTTSLDFILSPPSPAGRSFASPRETPLFRRARTPIGHPRPRRAASARWATAPLACEPSAGDQLPSPIRCPPHLRVQELFIANDHRALAPIPTKASKQRHIRRTCSVADRLVSLMVLPRLSEHHFLESFFFSSEDISFARITVEH